MTKLKPIIEQSFEAYAGAVLQSRALVDARDCLKPSARQIFYCLETDKFVHDKPYKKTLKAIGSAMRMYIHGDASCEGVIMRAGQPFCMRYPLIEVEGSYGNLMAPGNWSAARYTSSRLSLLADHLFEDIKKETIKEWQDNYDDTEQYPMVLPSKGFYNIVNPTMGIGVGAASSIPGFNLKEVNNALITLLWNPDATFDEIYCAPDFPTGATLLNEGEVKESLRNGQGKSCKLRATVEYDNKDKCLVVTEIPYSVYTNTICSELEAILESEENPGIDRFNDLTGENCLIKIYLKKNANANRVLRYLYKNTSLQYHYGINMTMLENGRFPRIFTWKEALQAHIDHEIEVYTRGFEFDVKKIKNRLHIIEGLFICMANIDEVVHTIKASTSTAVAAKSLQEKFLLDEEQTKAILEMKLARLAHLEVEKLEKEKTDLETKLKHIEAILNDKTLLKKEIEKGLRNVADKFGDARRTVILNIEGEDEDTVEKKATQISLTNRNNLIVSEISSLYTQKRGGVGSKIKLDKGEYIISTTSGNTTDILLIFSSKGNSYHLPISRLAFNEKIPVESLIKIQDHEVFCALATTAKQTLNQNIIFITKKGILKKSKISEYSSARAGGIKAITLDAGDEIVSALLLNDERIGIMSKAGQFILVETKDISTLGRTAKGRKGINLNTGDEVAAAYVVKSTTKELVSISHEGYIKRTPIDEFKVTSLNTKGVRIQKLKDDSDSMIDFCPLEKETSIIVVSSKAQIKVECKDISSLSRGTIGVKSMKIGDKDRIVGISLT